MDRDALDRYFAEAKSKNDEVRLKAARDVRNLVESKYRELSPGQFAVFYNNDVSPRIGRLLQPSLDTDTKIGGIHILNQLIDFKGDDAGQKTTRFAAYIRQVMTSTDTTAMVVAAKALGRLATPGGTLTAELVEAEVKSALEYLQAERLEPRRFAAVLILRELAMNSPTLMFQFVPQIFDVIWIALRDPKILIRESAAEAMSACFVILSNRENSARLAHLTRAYDEIKKGLHINTTESIHGSLLTVKELLENGRMFMTGARYRETSEIVFRYRDHRELLIRREVVTVLSRFATYSPTEFIATQLHQVMMHLIGLIKKPLKEPLAPGAFVAIGMIASAVGTNINQWLDSILVQLKITLEAMGRTKTIDQEPIFRCLSMISIATGHTLSKQVPSLLDPMFACGLSGPLIQALVDMSHYIPQSKGIIQDRLLDLLSHVLCGRSFSQLGGPQTTSTQPSIWTRDHKDQATIERREAEIALALETLSRFDFTGHVLNEFVRDVAIRYVDADNVDIRAAAAKTCCQLFIRDPIVYQTSHHAIQVVGDVIEKLLQVAIADPEPNIRQTVLDSLDPRFDRHLGRAENVRTIFLALNDEKFENREAAMTIIGRLTNINPAYVFPSLRKVLIQLLTEIEYSNNPDNKKESARLISHLVHASSKLIKPYVDPIVTVLLPKTKDSNPDVAATTLQAIGQLASVGGEELKKYIPALMSVIISNLQDQSSDSKRTAALGVLAQLALHSGYVIDPYKEHPELLAILNNMVKTEHRTPLRKQTVRLMGILGALDPDEYQKLSEKNPERSLLADAQVITDVSLIMTGLTPSNEDFYPTVVINTLMGLIKDSSLAQYHSAVIDAVMNIYTTMGLRCVQFLPAVVPGFITVIRAAAPSRAEGYFNQMSMLVRVVRHHIRPFLPNILDLIQEYWDQSPATILALIEAIARALEGEFKVYLASILPLMLGILDKDLSAKRAPSEKVIHAFLVFGSSAEEYMHLIVPAIVKMFDRAGQPQHIRREAIVTLRKLSRHVNLSEYASEIIHPLTRVLNGSDITLRSTALETLCALVYQLGPDYVHFIPTIQKVLTANRIPHSNYSLIVTKLQKGEPLPQDLNPLTDHDDDEDFIQAEGQSKKLAVNQQHLKQAWEASQRSTKEDWVEWMRRFSVELLRESPQQALRACAPLASVYNPVARSLFNSAFVSCWTELYDQYQEELVHALEMALTSTEIPPEILSLLLNLAEFMEHDDKALPIDVRVLGVYAAKCHAFAKALHYKELEFNAEQNPSAVEALISINNQLQQYDAAFGILRKAQNYHDVDLKETWFEKLFRWEEALNSYQKRELEEGESFDITMGKMRCLHALGEWDTLSTLAQEKWLGASQELRRSIAALAAAAAWGLGQWELMDNYLSVMRQSSPDKSFFSSILAIHRNQFSDAHTHIDEARAQIEQELSALLGESYNRAYLQILRVQMLAELEEIMVYKQNANNPEKLALMRDTWMKRLKGCQPNPEVWQRMLKVRALVITPRDSSEMWISYANLCRNNGRMGLAEKALFGLLEVNEDITGFMIERGHTVAPPIAYSAFKYMWANDERTHAYNCLKQFASKLSDSLSDRGRRIDIRPTANGVNGMNGHLTNGINGHGINSTNGINGINGSSSINGSTHSTATPAFALKELQEDCQLLARLYLKQGEWLTALNKGRWDDNVIDEVLYSYRAATQYNENWYKAWHAWALANFEVVTSQASAIEEEQRRLPLEIVQTYVIPAIQGFFKSIALSSTSSLQDTLRLLTLWFAHGAQDGVNATITEGFNTISIDTWLEVIPQLLARLNQTDKTVRRSIHKLLSDLGRAHPQALVFPLTVTRRSDDKSAAGKARSDFADMIMEGMKQHSARLVQEADLVSRELIRIAVLWHEQWHEGLEEASRLWFGDNNLEGMFAVLEPLHAMLVKGPETLREITFIQSFGRELQEAHDWCKNFKQTKEPSDLNAAWDLYYQVFRKINKHLPTIQSLELQYVSPKLKAVENLELAVPGTYDSGKPIIQISCFDPVCSVIQSKQRPRKVNIRGSDGQNHNFALKGHEDIRQDERVMQLFSLVNTLLENDTESRKRHLNIQKYSATPLSTQSGLLGWVPNSDTLHVLIREYRETRKILLNIEHRIMLQMAPDYEGLTLMQKVEVFGYALDNTTGQDLYRVLWLKSQSSEAWLGRRTNYTRSLAVMSMVGYILGLGDRHPSNLMLDKVTGKIVHIDFGDCFEVAMHREKYPERVPFRLTRMLTYAMEVSNIEGSYRTTCEHVMRVLRSNKESVIAVLEAFIHDPLLTWRLNNRESPPETSFPSERRASITGIQQQPTLDRPGSVRPRFRQMSTARPPTKEQEIEIKEVLNARAIQVLARIKEKLTGRDFKKNVELDIENQVDRLIREATNLENLCQHYIGWCSFW